MLWKGVKRGVTQSRLKALAEVADQAHGRDLELRLAEALREYESSYYAKVSSALDQNAEQAKQIVTQARTFISESRLAYAICRPILNHVMHWPSLSNRPDFEKNANGPFRYLGGEYNTSDNTQTTVVKFAYFSNTYTLRFLDRGISTWSMSDMHSYGKLELIVTCH